MNYAHVTQELFGQWQTLQIITYSMYFYECIALATKATVAITTFFPQYQLTLNKLLAKFIEIEFIKASLSYTLSK